MKTRELYEHDPDTPPDRKLSQFELYPFMFKNRPIFELNRDINGEGLKRAASMGSPCESWIHVIPSQLDRVTSTISFAMVAPRLQYMYMKQTLPFAEVAIACAMMGEFGAFRHTNEITHNAQAVGTSVLFFCCLIMFGRCSKGRRSNRSMRGLPSNALDREPWLRG